MGAQAEDDARPEAGSRAAEVDQRRSLMQAFGGGRGLLDTSVPALVFVMVFAVLRDLRIAAIAAICCAAVLLGVRLARKETKQFVIGGFVGVLIAAVVAWKTGSADNYFLPGIIKNAGFAVLYAVSVLVRWPLLGVVLGPLLGENFAWRQNRARRKAYALASLIWAVMFAVRFAVLLPLYLLHLTVALGIVNVVLGWPVFALVLWATWICLRRVPPVMVPGGGWLAKAKADQAER
ncbi:MAG: DUF3159 domain-containing protein [Streptosporangiales bacterium]